MKGILTLRKSVVMVAVCLAVLCLPGYSEPTSEQVKERTELLIEAVKHNNAEQAKVCIRLGAEVNTTFVCNYYDSYGNYVRNYYTPFTYAVCYSYKDIAELLIKAGADINVKIRDDETILTSVASMEGWKDITELLIKAGADVNAKTNDNGRFISGGTALMSAAYSGQKDSAELLIKTGADVNAKTDNGATTLMFAASAGNKDIAELLIKVGADVNAKTDNGETALMWAASRGYKNTAEVLIKAGADMNAKTNDGWTALTYTLSQQVWDDGSYPKDVAKLLIKAGADKNAALIWAVKADNFDAVKFLINAEADMNATDSDGLTLLTHAILYGRNDIADLLRAAGAKE
ncbi:MAG: ankyrin repeat domain-containing protein [Treponemataceae bacterium]|nr:ankyrin repeat domain-containing protein [Treponemataceae bacterium]